MTESIESIERVGKDILGLLINEYFDPKTAFGCLKVNKLFNKLVNKDKVIRKYLIYLEYEDNKEYIMNIKEKMCPICNQIFVSADMKHDTMTKHIKKHDKNKKKPNLQQGFMSNIFPIPKPCKHCDLPYLGNKVGHQEFCRLRRTKCAAHKRCPNDKAEILCDKPEGYLYEMRGHTCKYRCKKCREEFPSDQFLFHTSGDWYCCIDRI